jgi:regulator of sigma E protease
VAAGPIANFLLAIAIYTLLFAFLGEVVTPPRIGALDPDGPAAKAGFQLNDTIRSIDGQEVRSYADIERMITLNADHELTFDVERAGSSVRLKATPVWRDLPDPSGRKSSRPTIGIEPPLMPPRVGSVVSGGPAAAAGFQAGDVILSIDGRAVKSFVDMQEIVGVNTGRELAFEIDRGGTRLVLKAAPAEREDAANKAKKGVIGIKGIQEGEYRRYSPVEAFTQAVGRTYSIIADSLTALYRIATRSMPVDQLRGPAGIAEMAAQVATWGIVPLISFVAMISTAIGFFNLLPVPVLDGGHLLFYAIEAVRREPLSERAQEISFRIGLALVLLLFVFVTVIDVRRWVG